MSQFLFNAAIYWPLQCSLHTKEFCKPKFHQASSLICIKKVTGFLSIIVLCSQGGTLHGVITRAKKQDEILNEIEVLDWTVEILRGLQHLHDT